MSGPHGVGPPSCLCLLFGFGVDILKCAYEAPNAEACLCGVRAVDESPAMRLTTTTMKNKKEEKIWAL